MSEPKKFEAALDSDSRKAPVRVAFVTRRTSPHVKAKDDALVMSAWPDHARLTRNWSPAPFLRNCRPLRVEQTRMDRGFVTGPH
jgi:hypothetical protein